MSFQNINFQLKIHIKIEKNYALAEKTLKEIEIT